MTHYEPQLRISPRMWALAAAGALLLHFACIALVAGYMRDDDRDPESGASAIEIGVELLAKRAEATDLPPGPDAEESAASAAVPEQTKIVEHTTLPQEVPVKTEDPERLAAPIETKKPKEEEPVTPVENTSASAAAIASEATARPSSEVIQESERSVAPVQGAGESPKRVRATWQKELIAHLDRHKRYPARQSLDRVEVLVNFVVDETGHVLSSAIVRGSGEASFDEAALAMIRRSDPVPRPPALLAREELSLTLPVIFRVKHVNCVASPCAN